MPKTRHNDRKCIATGEALSPGDPALRFVADPDGNLIPDFSEKLPGRGAWVHARRSLIEKAVSKGSIARSLQRPARLPDGTNTAEFLDHIEHQMKARALGSLGLTRKAGQLVTGFDVVRRKRGNLIAYLTPEDAAPDGIRKMTAALETSERMPHIRLNVTAHELADALGDPGIVHVGLMAGRAAQNALFEIERWREFLADDTGR